jgi:hypothetical protein
MSNFDTLVAAIYSGLAGRSSNSKAMVTVVAVKHHCQYYQDDSTRPMH